MHVSASVSAKCGLDEQEHASRASAFSMAALFLIRTWSMDALLWVIGLGVEMLPRSRLCVQSLGFNAEVLRGRCEMVESEGGDCIVVDKLVKVSNVGSCDWARVGTRLESILLSSPNMN